MDTSMEDYGDSTMQAKVRIPSWHVPEPYNTVRSTTHSKALLAIRPDSERELAQDRQAEYALVTGKGYWKEKEKKSG